MEWNPHMDIAIVAQNIVVMNVHQTIALGTAIQNATKHARSVISVKINRSACKVIKSKHLANHRYLSYARACFCS